MQSSKIQPGVRATTKLNGRDQVVTVISKSLGTAGPAQWIVRTPAGNQVYRTARQLREIAAAPKAPPCPMGCAEFIADDDVCDVCIAARAASTESAAPCNWCNRTVCRDKGACELNLGVSTPDDGIDAVEDRAHARAMQETVAHGYTFSGWLQAAGRTDSASEYDLRAAWRVGENPAEYAR